MHNTSHSTQEIKHVYKSHIHVSYYKSALHFKSAWKWSLRKLLTCWCPECRALKNHQQQGRNHPRSHHLRWLQISSTNWKTCFSLTPQYLTVNHEEDSRRQFIEHCRSQSTWHNLINWPAWSKNSSSSRNSQVWLALSFQLSTHFC